MAGNRDYDNTAPRPTRRRETVIERSLRKAKGEDVDNDQDLYDDRFDDDDDYEPRSLDYPGGRMPYSRSGGGGCARSILYLVLGALAALLITFFFFNRTLGGIANFFGGAPNVAELIASPTPTIRMNSAAVVRRVQQLNRLETTTYTIEKVIEAEQTEDRIPLIGNFLRGDRLLLVAHGQIIAGIDLSKLDSDDVVLSSDGLSLTLRLPPAEIFSATLDNDQTRVYDRQRGWFAPDNKDLETLARQEAEREILRAACEDGILQRANIDGQRAMEQFLSLLDFQTVVVVPGPIGQCAAANGGTPTP